MSTPTGVYVHLPFCLSRCGYCDFAVVTDQDAAQERYVSSLEIEISYWASLLKRPASSLYCGGGTPSRLKADLFVSLMNRLNAGLPWEAEVERTCEANPESLGADVLSVWRESGVNRISLGVQSFDDEHLRILDRRHDRAGADQAIDRLRSAGFDNWSLDLMYGLPGQTLEEWEQDLRTALAYDPPHISFYHLILHPNLPTTRKALAAMPPDADDLFSEMFLLAVELFEASGRGVYELSNAARPGYECRHNLLYWKGGNWLGMGMSAAGLLEGRYHQQPAAWKTYLNLWESDDPAARMSGEAPSGKDWLLDQLMLRLRLREGIQYQELESLAPNFNSSRFVSLVGELESAGYLRKEAGRIALSPKGWLVHSEITTRLLGVVSPGD